MSIALKAENLSKAYQLGEIGTGTISRDLERWFARIRGKEDPFLRIGEVNNRMVTGISDVVWSLRDLNFEINQGEAVGIIGRNGAGKSTLLKILSKITAPTTGRITGKGRIASLLEVGTGFHPELTGKENIYLNGAILGMRKHEITRKFDEIVEFAGVSRYINTPVKRYSSGMYVRLAFAVAAHLESEILIVDEVLAVGDAEFQKKCLGKMSEISKGEGRTVLFVSHNMQAIAELCKSGIVLENGSLAFNGTAQSSIDRYLKNQNTLSNSYSIKSFNDLPIFTHIDLEVTAKQPKQVLRINFIVNKSNMPPAFVTFGIKNSAGVTVMEAYPSSITPSIYFNNPDKVYTCEVDLNNFIPDQYVVYAWLGPNANNQYDFIQDQLGFELFDSPMPTRTFPFSTNLGSIIADSRFIENKNDHKESH